MDLSPIISSLWPLPIGTIESTALMPVCTGRLTALLAATSGASFSISRVFVVCMGPFPSIGPPNASTTLPSRASPAGTWAIRPVVRTSVPSWIPASEPIITTPTDSSSRFNAMPIAPVENSTSSPYLAPAKPCILATPSPICITVPTSTASTVEPNSCICRLMIDAISWPPTAIVSPFFQSIYFVLFSFSII